METDLNNNNITANSANNKSLKINKVQLPKKVGVSGELKSGREAVVGLPNEIALVKLMDQSGYPITQNNGQRRYGPHPSYKGTPPPRGCEVFVGKLPRDCYEDELVPVFEKVGTIYELRLMMDYNGQNRGYGFVIYLSSRDAQRAVRTLNNYEIRKSRLIGVCHSVDNCRLFIGGIPKKVKKDEILEEISKVTDSVVNVIVYPSATDKSKNRGFAFVEYNCHRSAAMARRKLMNGKIQLWGHPIAVDWAEPEQDIDEDIMDQVKVLYIRNLQLNTTEETIENLFKKFAEVERVKKIKDYCFVHFVTREGARLALESVKEGESIDGAKIEVTLAKPVDKEHYRQQKAVAKLMQMANQYQHIPSFPHDFFPFNNQMHGGLMYPPPFLPSSQVGVRPLARGRGRTAAGSRSAGGRAYILNGFLPQLHPLLQAGSDHLYDILPGMNLSPTNPVTLKPQSRRTPMQVLEEMCIKNNWGTPIYTLHSTVNNDRQLFLYKITIPPLGNTYQPQKLCCTIEEAKVYAAEYTLSQITNETSPQVSPVSPFPLRLPTPAYVPITTRSVVASGVVTKVTWPNGVPHPPAPYYDYSDHQHQSQQVYFQQ